MHVISDRLEPILARYGGTWQRLRASAPLDSPFFSPDYFRAFDQAVSPVEVAVVLDGDEPVVFWPFVRNGERGVAVGASISEITGPISVGDTRWDPPAVLRAAGLNEWSFDCIPADPIALAPFHLCRRVSPVIDLRDGFENYHQQLRERGSRSIRETERKTRRLAREFSSVRFAFRDQDASLLPELIRWKREQYRRTGAHDPMRSAWFEQLLQSIHRTATADFRGVLSTLYLDDRPAALHFGIQSGDVLAWWFTAYDPDWSHLSPGSVLLLHVIGDAAAEGVRRIDLGQGEERYKNSFSNGEFPVAEGVISLQPWKRVSRRAWIGLREWADNHPKCRGALKVFRRLREVSS